MHHRQRSTSLSLLPYNSQLSSKEVKNMRRTHRSISKLKMFKTGYDKQYQSVKPEISPEDEYEQERGEHLFKDDFQLRCKKLCEELCFNLNIFQKLYSHSSRKKGILVKLYGWDRQFEDSFFIKGKQDLRPDITPQSLCHRLGLSVRAFTARNRYNKLRLFLNQLINNNKKQQELQSKFMKLRLLKQMSTIDQQMVKIIKKKDKPELRGFIQQIGMTQDMMVNSKIRAHNRLDDLIRLQKECGKVRVNDFYGKQEHDINDVQKYFIKIRLEKQKLL